MNIYRKDFPILKRRVNGKALVYLDNGATTQKPNIVIKAMFNFYTNYNANIHRGLHTLSQESTDACDEARVKVKKLVHARSEHEIVFTYGTTEGINTVAYAWGNSNIRSGDEMLITEMEHHANIVPWQELAKRKRAQLLFAPLGKNRELDYDAFSRMISKKTKLVSFVHVSNVLGVTNDVKRIVNIVRKKSNATILLDAAQSIAHMPINVQKLDIDFMVFSGHKMYGPTGIGVLYGKKEILDSMPPFLTGGDMIMEVTKERSSFQDVPRRFEAGTPHIAGIIGLGTAVDYLLTKGLKNLNADEKKLSDYTYEQLTKIKGLQLYSPRSTHGIFSFNIDGIHAHDVAEIVNRFGVAIRSGNHCAMPLHRNLDAVATARASLACYNTKEEVDVLVKALREVRKIFS